MKDRKYVIHIITVILMAKWELCVNSQALDEIAYRPSTLEKSYDFERTIVEVLVKLS